MRHIVILCLVVSVSAGDARGGPAAGPLTIDRLMDIRHPSSAVWSPDGQRIAFLWDRAGVPNIWIVDAEGRSAPQALTAYESGQVGGLFWSKDGQRVFFSRSGDLWQAAVAPAGEPPRPVWTTAESETNITPSPDGTRVAFTRPSPPAMPDDPRTASDLWVRSLADGHEARLTGGLGVVSGGAWSPDGARLVFSVSQLVRHEEAPPYSGTKLLYTWTERSPSQVYVVPATGGQAIAIAPSPDSTPGARWIDSSRLAVERQTHRYKRREILVADAATGAARLAHEDIDEKWWSLPGDSGSAAMPSPDGRWIAFVSDRDGWDHLYVMPSAGGAPIQLTTGPFEVWRPAWSGDSKQIAFDSNQGGSPGSRHLGVATIGADPAHASVKMVTAGRGADIAPTWAPDGRRLVYQHTDPQNSADLFVVDTTSSDAKPTRLTDSMPAAIDRSAFVEPQFVHYPGPDGKPVPAYLFVLKGLDRLRKHPAIVWIHGDGINQNYDGWHVQRNYAVYYSFHQYLAQRGYVVLAPDYRGSIGYGKEWRQGVYMDVGGKDHKDAAMGADYLKTLGYVDPERIGVWGLSYGGFFTLQALADRPTLFRCGVDVAGVVDYRMYYADPYHGAWTVGRIGTPEENPSVYDVAAPLARVDRIVRPLLVLHGTNDVNVPYLESVRLIDELLKRGKAVEFMMYPGEFHYFQREHVLRDAWGRVERFFDRHLRAPAQQLSRESTEYRPVEHPAGWILVPTFRIRTIQVGTVFR